MPDLPWLSLLSAKRTEIRRAQKPRIGIEDHLDGHRVEHLLERRLRAKRRDEAARFERAEDLRCDASADEHTARRNGPKREVSRFRTVGVDVQIKNLAAAPAGAAQCRAGDRRSRIR